MGADCVTAPSDVSGHGARLEYDIVVDAQEDLNVAIGILPTQDINPARGLRLGIALDGGEGQILDARRGLHDEFKEYTADNLSRSKVLKPLPEPKGMSLNGFRTRMRKEVFDNMRWLDYTFEGVPAGKHVLKIIMVDPEVVVERLVINPDDNHYSYFGPPEK